MVIGYGLSDVSQLKMFADAVCDVLGHGKNVNAADLICETAAAETQCGTVFDKTRNGAGRGLFQCDKVAFEDVIARSNIADIQALEKAFDFDLRSISWEALNYSPLIAAAVCRLHYNLRPGVIPLDLRGRAEYWKKFYNTTAGKGTIDHYMESVKRFEMYV